MEVNKERLYTLRWYAKKIIQESTEEKVDNLAYTMAEIISSLLEEPIPDDLKPKEPERPNIAPVSTVKVAAPNTKRLWYPPAIQVPKMKAKGAYPKGYPYGCVVHFTAGNYKNGKQNAIDSCSYGATQGFLYMCMGTDGVIVQPNNFSEWGYHAGESAWDINGKKVKNVSDHLIGMEMCNPGRLGLKNGKYYTYFDTNFQNPIDPKDVRIITKDDDNIQMGAYLPYTKEQEKSLIEFLIWMKANNPSVFSFDYVAGHDECAGVKGIGYSRKNDPGGALSMTMTKFRELLKVEYAKRYL